MKKESRLVDLSSSYSWPTSTSSSSCLSYRLINRSFRRLCRGSSRDRIDPVPVLTGKGGGKSLRWPPINLEAGLQTASKRVTLERASRHSPRSRTRIDARPVSMSVVGRGGCATRRWGGCSIASSWRQSNPFPTSLQPSSPHLCVCPCAGPARNPSPFNPLFSTFSFHPLRSGRNRPRCPFPTTPRLDHPSFSISLSFSQVQPVDRPPRINLNPHYGK